MEVEYNSFADARITGYGEGFFAGLYAKPKNLENAMQSNRTNDYISWFEQAYDAGYVEALTFKVHEVFCKEDFMEGLFQGWKEGYNFGYDQIFTVEHVENPNNSYLMGFDIGMYDGEFQGGVRQSNEDRCIDMMMDNGI